MSVSLAWLAGRLAGLVPAADGTPSDEQYEDCVRDAAADYSRRNPSQKVATLAIVAGVASYALPADFVRLISLEGMTSTDVLITNAGLVPMDVDWNERYTIAGGKISFTPTPLYNMARRVWYAAGQVLDASDTYPDMADEDAGLVLLKAQALALSLKANVAAQGGWKYQMGDEMVDKTAQAKGLQTQADALEKRYQDGVARAVGLVGGRGSSAYGWKNGWNEVGG